MPVPRVAPPLVLSVGGSVLQTGHDDDAYLVRLATLLRRLGRRQILVVTTGGGRTAREYIRLGRSVGLTEVELDDLGIDVTRIHARLLAALIGPPTPAHPPLTLAAAVHEAHRSSPIVLGGTEPGHTTDAVASLIAVRLRAARVVNATRVDGIYEHDPKLRPGARRFSQLAWPQFRRMIDKSTTGEAGQEYVFDRLGAEALSRARIPLRVVDGRDLPNLDRALRGLPFVGSEVR
ncbi:MAG TPA: UMP kinase [Thermoplasmata archaeon]|nr:UMP kinase [Thermoplasmata archaeon]